MWQDYDASYRGALEDSAFLAWRELGARKKAENIVRVCQEINPVSLVEIGCGTGAVLRMLHAMNFAQKYCCIDLSLSAIGFTVKSCDAFTPRAVVGRADALPFPDGAFSVAVLSHVIEHLDHPVSALREATRIAHFVVVEVPTEKVLCNFVRRKVLSRPYASIAEAGHVQFWSPASIAEFLTHDAGLEILNRRLDLLGGEMDVCRKLPRTKSLVKRTLKSALPVAVYSRLLTTHAVFLCRRRSPNF